MIGNHVCGYTVPRVQIPVSPPHIRRLSDGWPSFFVYERGPVSKQSLSFILHVFVLLLLE